MQDYGALGLSICALKKDPPTISNRPEESLTPDNYYIDNRRSPCLARVMDQSLPLPADQERTERHLRNLGEMAEIGMTLIRVAQEQILQQIFDPKSCPAHPLLGRDLSLTITRLARTVRQTMALENYFADPLNQTLLTFAIAKIPRQAKDQTHPTENPEPRETTSGETPRAEPRERLLQDLNEHLTIPDIAKMLAERPLGAIIKGLCDDLGIEPASCGWTSDLLAEPLAGPAPTHAPTNHGKTQRTNAPNLIHPPFSPSQKRATTTTGADPPR